jgi:hypothetical protein
MPNRLHPKVFLPPPSPVLVRPYEGDHRCKRLRNGRSDGLSLVTPRG